jgi:hypothetical protein
MTVYSVCGMICKHVLDFWIKKSLIEALNKKYQFKIFCFSSRDNSYCLFYISKCQTDLEPCQMTSSEKLSRDCEVRPQEIHAVLFSWAPLRASVNWIHWAYFATAVSTFQYILSMIPDLWSILRLQICCFQIWGIVENFAQCLISFERHPVNMSARQPDRSWIYLFTCSLSNDAVSHSEYSADWFDDSG